MQDRHTFEKVCLTELQFARLLGISVEEFGELNRSEMYAYIRPSGVIVEYFMYIHPDTPNAIKARLNIEKNNFLKFSYEQIQALLTEE